MTGRDVEWTIGEVAVSRCEVAMTGVEVALSRGEVAVTGGEVTLCRGEVGMTVGERLHYIVMTTCFCCISKVIMININIECAF